jgi:hypothetical protein
MSSYHKTVFLIVMVYQSEFANVTNHRPYINECSNTNFEFWVTFWTKI